MLAYDDFSLHVTLIRSPEVQCALWQIFPVICHPFKAESHPFTQPLQHMFQDIMMAAEYFSFGFNMQDSLLPNCCGFCFIQEALHPNFPFQQKKKSAPSPTTPLYRSVSVWTQFPPCCLYHSYQISERERERERRLGWKTGLLFLALPCHSSLIYCNGHSAEHA